MRGRGVWPCGGRPSAAAGGHVTAATARWHTSAPTHAYPVLGRPPRPSPLCGGRHGRPATGRNHSFAQTHQKPAGARSVSGNEPLRTANRCKPVRRIYKRRKQKQTSKTEPIEIHWGCNALGAGLGNTTLAWLMASANPPEALLQPPPGQSTESASRRGTSLTAAWDGVVIVEGGWGEGSILPL